MNIETLMQEANAEAVEAQKIHAWPHNRAWLRNNFPAFASLKDCIDENRLAVIAKAIMGVEQ